MSEFDAVAVLSDLHLAPESDLLSFHAHKQLVTLIDCISVKAKKMCLIFNGDVFDFLQLPDYNDISLPLAPFRMNLILDSLDSEPVERNIVQALKRFTGKGHALFFIPGNHDPELALCRVQDVLKGRLGASTLIQDEHGNWILPVGCINVTGTHGHRFDPFNEISTKQMQIAEERGDDTVSMPPGSRLVRDVINPYRRALNSDGKKRFPFVDALPSELAVVYALLYLDPNLASKRFVKALGTGLFALRRALAIALNPPRLLNAAQSKKTNEEMLLEAFSQNLVLSMTDAELANSDMALHEINDFLLNGVCKNSEGRKFLNGNSHWGQRLILRAFAREIASTRSISSYKTPDSLAEHLMCDRNSCTRSFVTVTGHTHVAKSIKSSYGFYINTGTWQDSIQIPDVLSEASVADWLDKLQKDEIIRLFRCPVAIVEKGGAHLMHWDGSDFQPWTEIESTF